MKKLLYAGFISILVFQWSSCKKSKNDTPSEPVFRISAETTWINDKLTYKNEYLYKDNKLITKNLYGWSNSNWVLGGKEEFDYPSTDVSSFIYYLNIASRTWSESYKIESTKTNGKLTNWMQLHHETGSWNPEQEEEYIYNDGNLLTEWNEYQYINGSRTSVFGEKFNYTGNKITSAFVSHLDGNDYKEFAKCEMTYESDILKQIMIYLKNEASWSTSAKFEFNYLNDKLTTTNLSYYDNPTWYLTQTWTFNYDASGNLVGEMKNKLYPAYSEKIEYTYEQAEGNYSDFQCPYDFATSGIWYPLVTKKGAGPLPFTGPVIRSLIKE